MVVAHFVESGQRRRLRWGPSRERTANGRAAVAAGSTAKVHRLRSTKRPGRGHVGSARPVQTGPQGAGGPGIGHGDSSRAEYARRNGRVILLERGWIAAQLRSRRGQAVVRRTVPPFDGA